MIISRSGVETRKNFQILDWLQISFSNPKDLRKGAGKNLLFNLHVLQKDHEVVVMVAQTQHK